MKIVYILLSLLCLSSLGYGQQKEKLSFTIVSDDQTPVPFASLQLFQNTTFIKAALTDTMGNAVFDQLPYGAYRLEVSQAGYRKRDTILQHSRENGLVLMILTPAGKMLEKVSVGTKKPFIAQANGKTIINVESSITNVGATILEVLEKSPGVMVDKNGGIALQGKTGVLVLIDDKPTYLSGTDLNNYLGGMSASQVVQIELMTNPPAKYDASGNAGIINIKTKKGTTRGFNTTINLSGSQGFYPKTNNGVNLNYRNSKVNYFFNYSFNFAKYYTDIYAYRKYYNNNKEVTAILDQPTSLTGKSVNQILKAGLDYYVSRKTTLGLVIGGTHVNRDGDGVGTATWLNELRGKDSAVVTRSTSKNIYKNKMLNANVRHSFNKQQELSADIDYLDYDITADQQFNNQLQAPGGYLQVSRGHVPNHITIVAASANHSLHLGEKISLQSGIKSSHIKTDNVSLYQKFESGLWQEDYGKSNHFIYNENIRAAYSSVEAKGGRWAWQVGLRYELTGYDARQLGNVQQKDSAFSKNYGGLFPSGYISYQADSNNNFTLTASRRIDRPPFRVLNPFTFIINKYTYQNGNPYIVPQYSNNIELSHQYKKWLTSSISYSTVKNYFSQIFLNDTTAGLLYYSQGNVGRAVNVGVGATLMLQPTKGWSFTLHSIFNHKELKGFNQDADFSSQVNQLSVNMNNQFSFAKIYSGELSGFYTSRARNDLQEVLYPIGQLSVGVSRPVMQKKGTIKINIRDVFHNKAMEGFTNFPNATEYFYLSRDSRVVNLAFTYRFGKAYKTARRSAGSAADEMERVGS